VAGDNLNIPFFGHILRMCGAFFIRRSFGGDVLYKAVFQEYVKQLLIAGQSMECFIEGGRSRNGKLLPPKIGFLQCVVNNVIEGHIDDALVVPMSLAYDRLLEANSYVAEMQGGKKQTERLVTTLQAGYNLVTSGLRKLVCYGQVYVSIAEPISIRKYYDTRTMEQLRSRSSETLKGVSQADQAPEEVTGSQGPEEVTGSQGPEEVPRRIMRTNSYDREIHEIVEETEASRKNQISLALSLGYSSLYESNVVSKILPTTLVGTILLLHKERGLRMKELVERVRWLQQQVVQRGGQVTDDSISNLNKSVATVVDRIMSSRGHSKTLVKRHKELLITGVFMPEERMELSMFRNQLLHIFVLEGLIACGFHQVMWLRRDEVNQVGVKRGQLMESCAYLSTLLKLEFIFKPSEVRDISSIKANFERGLRGMISNGVLTEGEEGRLTLLAKPSSPVKGQFVPPDLFEFLCSLFCPFVDSYWLAALSLFKLFPATIVTEDAMVAHAQLLGEKLYFDGQLDNYEAISKETVKNAFLVFVDMKVITRVRITGDKSKSLQLSQDWRSEEELKAFIAKIHSYRSQLGASAAATKTQDGLPPLLNLTELS